jgi:glyoxylase-like metal-dependent hydrolase (beta-lactamase superfamily II)
MTAAEQRPAKPAKQEQEPASTDVTEVADGILRMQLPISFPGLGHVNCYALEDERGLVIVDPGLPGPGSWKALLDRLRRAGHAIRDVHTVVVTHSHPDHFGGAGTVRHHVGADIIAHTTFRTWFDAAEDEALADDESTPNDDGDGRADARQSASPWRQKLPWKDETFRPPTRRRLRMRVMRALARRYVKAPTPDRRVDEGDVVKLGRREWLALHTPGHTSDHLCLFDPADGVLLAGDHVLPTITPHISGLVAGADPLTQFFESLDKVAGLASLRLALPAHGHPFTDVPSRVEAIKRHHEERLETLVTAAAELGPATVEALSQRLFKPRSWGQMAESETYAHLEHLRQIGRARVVPDSGPDLRFELVE